MIGHPILLTLEMIRNLVIYSFVCMQQLQLLDNIYMLMDYVIR
jgi:hypothetical protein